MIALWSAGLWLPSSAAEIESPAFWLASRPSVFSSAGPGRKSHTGGHPGPQTRRSTACIVAGRAVIGCASRGKPGRSLCAHPSGATRSTRADPARPLEATTRVTEAPRAQVQGLRGVRRHAGGTLRWACLSSEAAFERLVHHIFDGFKEGQVVEYERSERATAASA